ncbi:MAG: hypothetical protein Q8L60_04905 [Gammaproteobacteria bacterium]|nr:hypothetical protein [Gammaproteobacteria bacterium]MDP2346994.1 hypothetical protein [Gammaproteobacteria bacterium]
MNHPRMLAVAVLSVILLGLMAIAQPTLQVEYPANTSSSDSSNRLIRLGPDDDLQDALNKAVSGDVIELQAGAIYQGPFVLRKHGGPGWVTITSSTNAQHPLPPAGVRVTPEHAAAMAALVAATGSVISTDPAAARYHFIGVEIRPESRNRMPDYIAGIRRTITNLVELSASNNSVQTMPHHIVFERSYLHGDPVQGTRRGIVMNGAHLAVIDSHLADFKSTEDSQAVAGWEGTGPFLIHNNYLEAAGENLMFGGADPHVADRTPSDITITGNHFSKPLSWQEGHVLHDGSDWSVKNLLELKNARRVVIDGNLFEHNWPDSQNGFAILFTVRNQDGKSPWSLVEDVTFSNNILRRVAAGINILGYDDNYASGRTQNVRIHNNLFYEIGDDWGSGLLLQLLDSPADIEFTHNTAMQSAAILSMEGDPVPGMDISWNVFMENSAGISGTNTGPGQHSIDTYMKAPVTIEGNVLIGAGAAAYPSGVTRVTEFDSLPFIDPPSGDYRLQDLRGGTFDGFEEIPGVNFGQLCAALSNTDRPLFC